MRLELAKISEREVNGAEGGNCSQLPLTLRPVITFAGIFRRVA